MGNSFRGVDRDNWRDKNKKNKKHSFRNGDGKFVEKTRTNRFDNITQSEDDDNYPDEERGHR